MENKNKENKESLNNQFFSVMISFFVPLLPALIVGSVLLSPTYEEGNILHMLIEQDIALSWVFFVIMTLSAIFNLYRGSKKMKNN